MKTNLLYYIGERQNPQLRKPYYKLFGQLSKKDAEKKEECLYGAMYLTPYNTEEEYNQKIESLRLEGFTVTN